MLKEEAAARAMGAGRGKNFWLETWYCGIINQKVEEAAERGQYEVKVRFSARSYVVRHQQRFIELYEAKGYQARFRPNYVHIEPSQYDLILQWYPEKEEKMQGMLTD